MQMMDVHVTSTKRAWQPSAQARIHKAISLDATFWQCAPVHCFCPCNILMYKTVVCRLVNRAKTANIRKMRYYAAWHCLGLNVNVLLSKCLSFLIFSVFMCNAAVNTQFNSNFVIFSLLVVGCAVPPLQTVLNCEVFLHLYLLIGYIYLTINFESRRKPWTQRWLDFRHSNAFENVLVIFQCYVTWNNANYRYIYSLLKPLWPSRIRRLLFAIHRMTLTSL